MTAACASMATRAATSIRLDLNVPNMGCLLVREDGRKPPELNTTFGPYRSRRAQVCFSVIRIADDALAQDLMDVLPGLQCTNGGGCSDLKCTLDNQGVVSPSTIADALASAESALTFI